MIAEYYKEMINQNRNIYAKMNTTIVEVEKLNDSWSITIFDSKENDYNIPPKFSSNIGNTKILRKLINQQEYYDNDYYDYYDYGCKKEPTYFYDARELFYHFCCCFFS